MARLFIRFFRLSTFLLLIYSIDGVAADRYWVGASAGNWNNNANWSTTSNGAGGASYPQASDKAIFTSYKVTNCTLNINTIGGIDVQSGYTGSILQSSGTKVTIGTSNAVFSAGIFSGSSDSIIVNGTFTLSGGTFTSTSGVLVLKNTVTSSSGSFNKNNGIVNFAATASQTIPAWSYYDLVSSSTGARVLASSGTINISNTFTKGSNTYTITGSSINYNGSGAQTVIAFNYNNLSISGSRSGNITLANSGTIGIAGNFESTATFSSGGYVNTGSTINYNGTGAQTIRPFDYNALTVSGSRTSNNITLSSTGTIKVAGAFTFSATFTTGSIINTGSNFEYNGTIAQTIAAINYNNLTSSSSGSRTLASSGEIGVAGAFTKGTNTYTITGSTFNYYGSGAQNITDFSYNNLFITGQRGSNSITFPNGGTVKIAKSFWPLATFTSGSYITTNSTIEFNGSLAQTIPAFNYNNIVSSSSGARSFGTSGTISISGTFTKGTNTYSNFGKNGDAYQPVNSASKTTFSSTHSVDKDTAYVVGTGGLILKTTDGGQTWVQKTSGVTTDLRHVKFYNSQNGIIVGSSGLILRTTNWGNTWSSVSSGTAQILSGICYNGADTIIVTAANGSIIKSKNGGASWLAPLSISSQGLYQMVFISPSIGFVVGNLGTILKTTNAGYTWTSITNPASTYLLLSICFTNSSTGYIAGGNSSTFTGIVLKSTDGGATWATNYTSSDRYFTAISFNDSLNGFIATGNVANNTGSIFRTRDSGTNWVSVETGTNRLGSLSLVGTNGGYFAGLNGTVIKYSCCSDGGSIEFNKAGYQSINGGSTSVLFNKLIVNKASGKLYLNAPVQVDKKLTITKGIIVSSTSNILQFSDNVDTVARASDSTYVYGPVKKTGNDSFKFPLGDTTLASGAYHPLVISAPSATTDAYTARYYAQNQTYGSGLQTDSLESISNCEYYTLNRDAGTSVVIPTISWNSNSCNVFDSYDVCVAGWNGTQWNKLGKTSISYGSSSGTVTANTGLNLTFLPLVIANPKLPFAFSDAILKPRLDASFYNLQNGFLKFKYYEEYINNGNELDFKIYDKDRNVVLSNTSPSVNLIVSKYRDNRFSMNLNALGLSAGYYVLEVKDKKGEIAMLRFKK